MSAPTPQFIPEAFAMSAAGTNRNTIPAAPITSQRASFDLGFPPQTMTPIVAGGKPMLGPDMNGILYMLSSHTFYQQSGQPYRWNADVVVAIGGYAKGTILGSTDNVTIWFNTVAGNSSDPDAAGAGWEPMFSYGITLMPGTTGGTVTLTPAQATKSVLVLSGALVANLQIVLPKSLRRWLIVNTTSGGFTTTVKTALGTGVPIPQGGYAAPTEVYGNGTNIYNVVAPITLPTSVSPTANTIVLRSNAGYVYATFLNQSSALDNFTISEVYAGVGDGFLRKINRTNFAANFLLSWFAGQVTNAQVPQGAVTQYKAPILSSAALTGTPTAPTAAAGNDSTQVANTAFIQNVIQAIFGSANTVVKTGTVAFAAGSDTRTVNLNFPTDFPNSCAVFLATCLSDDNVFAECISKSAAGASVEICQRENGGNFNAGSFMYIAIGT